MRTSALIFVWLLTALNAQDPPALAEVRALDKEIQKLPDLPEATRDAAFRSMVQRILEEPKQYQLPLASNLAVSAGEVAIAPETLQGIANLLVRELGDKPGNGMELAISYLADFSFYRYIRVSVDAPMYLAELAKLQDQARVRANADFTLMDTKGKAWHLKDLCGNVVLVNFWATWCPPCQREMEAFQAMHKRFADKGLLILAVTGEDVATVNRYLAKRPLAFNVLLDPGGVTQKQFLVDGIPHSLLYDREGKLVAQFDGPPTAQQLLDTLGQAGLK